jgi:hypothetical protein
LSGLSTLTAEEIEQVRGYIEKYRGLIGLKLKKEDGEATKEDVPAPGDKKRKRDEPEKETQEKPKPKQKPKKKKAKK